MMDNDGNSGKGRGRAAMLEHLAANEDPPQKLPSIGRGAALLRMFPSRDSDNECDRRRRSPQELPPSGGRGQLLHRLSSKSSAFNETHSTPSSSEPDQCVDTTPQPSTSQQSTRTGGRGRGDLMKLINQKNVQEKTENASELPVQQQRPPERKENNERPEPVRKHGHSGRKIKATANLIPLKLRDPSRGIYEYEVNFDPDLDDRRQRLLIVNAQFRKHANVKIFDGGTLLYSPERLQQDITRERATLQSGLQVEVIFKYKRTKPLSECLNILNIIFKRIANELCLVKFGRHYYNPKKMIKIQQYKLSLWPGGATVVEECEGGIHLLFDSSHRVLRDQRCLEILREIAVQYRDKDVKIAISQAFIGQSVITTYNNRIYKVDDVSFDENPLSTFVRNGQEISYVDYYKSQRNITIHDLTQPMFVNRVKKKPKGKENVDLLLFLVPELCCPTGLTDEMRKNYKLMKNISQCSRSDPNQRQKTLSEFVESIKENPRANAHLENWGLVLPDSTIEDTARVLDPERIYFGKGRAVEEANADWSRALSSYPVLSPIDLVNWAVVHVNRDAKYSGSFLETAKQVSTKMGIRFNKPIIRSIANDNARTFCGEIRQLVQEKIQIVVVIFPSIREDRYAVVKKLCYAELEVPCQVIIARTLSKPQSLKSITVNIMVQMNCKLGGTLWGVNIPYKEKGIMFCGIDMYHDALKRTQSVVALVSSLNKTCTRWTCAHAFHNRGQEISEVLTGLLRKNLEHWYNENNAFPERIVVYRDGVGDGQFQTVRDFEVPQFEKMFSVVSADYNPMLTYLIVQKRISQRIYAVKGSEFVNPPPGTVMDHTITRRDWYDFFLVSQNVRQGTVSPTHYVVVKDSSDMTPDQVQRLTYKMTHLYYNWSGTVCVAAPCQYAHKLAYMIGQYVHAPTNESLNDKLFFL